MRSALWLKLLLFCSPLLIRLLSKFLKWPLIYKNCTNILKLLLFCSPLLTRLISNCTSVVTTYSVFSEDFGPQCTMGIPKLCKMSCQEEFARGAWSKMDPSCLSIDTWSIWQKDSSLSLKNGSKMEVKGKSMYCTGCPSGLISSSLPNVTSLSLLFRTENELS